MLKFRRKSTLTVLQKKKKMLITRFSYGPVWTLQLHDGSCSFKTAVNLNALEWMIFFLVFDLSFLFVSDFVLNEKQRLSNKPFKKNTAASKN